MPELVIEPTNACNRNCVHCLRDKLGQRVNIPLSLFKRILDQALDLGITYVSLTGGEPTLHPDFGKLLIALSDRGIKFNMVTNGREFGKEVLPWLIKPNIRRHLTSICLSLDGASPETHDALRGEGSLYEVIEAANLCHLKGIPFSIKTLVSNINKKELTEIALLGAALGAKHQGFIAPCPTPQLVEKDLVPSREDMRKLYSFISGSLIPSMKTQIVLECHWYNNKSTLITCNPYQQIYNVDYLGNLIFCCNLSHVRNDPKPATLGREFLVDLKNESLKGGITQHYQLLAQFTEDRLRDTKTPAKLFSNPCYWCLNYFDKLEWTKNYSNSSWVKENIGEV